MALWQRPRPRSTLATVAEVPQEDEAPHTVYIPKEHNFAFPPEKRNPLDIFNSDRTFQLGFPDSHTFLVWTQRSNEAHALQDCAAEDWTDQRAMVAQIAKTNTGLVGTHFIFQDNNRIYVASDITDISLADIIPCSILNEIQVSAILRQLVNALLKVKAEGIQYNNVIASNVFISRKSVVQLANFQLEKDPLGFTKNGKNSDCVAIGELALYMLSKDLRSNTAFKGQLLWSQKRENMVEMPSGYMIDASMSLSTGLIDFLDTCMRESDDLEALINHPFLKTEVDLGSLVRYAERKANRPCRKLNGQWEANVLRSIAGMQGSQGGGGSSM